jgi:mono/diheme cytochrome c family protein
MHAAVRVGLPLLLVLLIGACGPTREDVGDLPVWTPADHQQPEQPGAGQAAPADTPQDREAALTQAAARLWSRACATCHGEGGAGDGPELPEGVQLANLSTPAYQDGVTDEAMAEVIANGRGVMPGYVDRLGPQGVAALVAHVRRLRRDP